MDRQLFVAVVFCLCFANTLSIKCYTGTDRQCILLSNTNGCGDGEICQCAKYRFQCTDDDQACDKHEKQAKIMKWSYAIVTKTTCEELKAAPSLVKNLTCCSTDQCNRPSNGECSFSQSRRRRAVRKLTDLLDF